MKHLCCYPYIHKETRSERVITPVVDMLVSMVIQIMMPRTGGPAFFQAPGTTIHKAGAGKYKSREAHFKDIGRLPHSLLCNLVDMGSYPMLVAEAASQIIHPETSTILPIPSASLLLRSVWAHNRSELIKRYPCFCLSPASSGPAFLRRLDCVACFLLVSLFSSVSSSRCSFFLSKAFVPLEHY